MGKTSGLTYVLVMVPRSSLTQRFLRIAVFYFRLVGSPLGALLTGFNRAVMPFCEGLFLLLWLTCFFSTPSLSHCSFSSYTLTICRARNLTTPFFNFFRFPQIWLIYAVFRTFYPPKNTHKSKFVTVYKGVAKT